MKVEEFIRKIDKGEAKVLTLEAAKNLKGRRIEWMYFGYELNINVVSKMTVGNIVSSYDYHKTQPCEGYNSRAEYWESYMTATQLDAEKTKLLLFDENGNETYCSAHTKYYNIFDEITFTCSDSDREVYYIEIEK